MRVFRQFARTDRWHERMPGVNAFATKYARSSTKRFQKSGKKSNNNNSLEKALVWGLRITTRSSGWRQTGIRSSCVWAVVARDWNEDSLRRTRILEYPRRQTSSTGAPRGSIVCRGVIGAPLQPVTVQDKRMVRIVHYGFRDLSQHRNQVGGSKSRIIRLRTRINKYDCRYSSE